MAVPVSGSCRVRAAFLSFLLVLALGAPALAASLPVGFSEQALAGGLNSPTAMQVAPDGRIFITLQGGDIRIWDPAAGLLPTPFATIAVAPFNGTERGLLGIALDLNFTVNRFVYVYYTTTTPTIHNRLGRLTANGNVATSNTPVTLVDFETLGPTNHNGGALNFGPDGMLYVAVGENAIASNSQTLANRLGKIHRYDTTAFAQGGSLIPTNNPFYNTATGDNRSIWALGLRNPYTFAFNPGGVGPGMFINDVGAGTYEEINEGGASRNYGWPTTEGDFDPTVYPNFTRPTYYYEHANNACAITGGAFYAPTVVTFGSDYANDYFFADFCAGWIRRLDPAKPSTDPQRVLPFASGLSSPVDLKVTADGSLYYLQRGGSSQLYRVTSTAAQPPAPPTGVTIGASGLTLTLSWNAAANATSYVAEVGTSSGASNLVAANVGNVTSVSGPVPEGTYFLRVRSVNAVGTSAPSAEVRITVSLSGSCTLPPVAPPSFTAQTSGLVARMTWGAASGATTYVLEAGSASGLSNLAVADLGNVTSLVASALPGTYFVRVRGVNACGAGSPSAEVPLTLSCASLAPPSGLAFSRSGSLVTFSWTGALGYSSYTMEIGSAPGLSNLFSGVLGPATSFQASVAGTPAGTYYIRVRGISLCGVSGVSNEVAVTLP